MAWPQGRAARLVVSWSSTACEREKMRAGHRRSRRMEAGRIAAPEIRVSGGCCCASLARKEEGMRPLLCGRIT